MMSSRPASAIAGLVVLLAAVDSFRISSLCRVGVPPSSARLLDGPQSPRTTVGDALSGDNRSGLTRLGARGGMDAYDAQMAALRSSAAAPYGGDEDGTEDSPAGHWSGQNSYMTHLSPSVNGYKAPSCHGGDAAWYDDDIVVTLVPKFKIKEGMRDKYMELLPKFIELVKANEEKTCVHYGFVGPTEDDFVICREGYVSAEGVLVHLDNVGDVLNQALEYADIVDLMVQGPAAELEKLKEPLADFGPAYYPLAEGSLRNKRGW
mmetsp:Transcript_11617/g.27286  ORF Transcript_11617/g.27286 Transcript_11617/m.27286 type:complete len:263 (-) Transcript_11617:63-851(-)